MFPVIAPPLASPATRHCHTLVGKEFVLVQDENQGARVACGKIPLKARAWPIAIYFRLMVPTQVSLRFLNPSYFHIFSTKAPRFPKVSDGFRGLASGLGFGIQTTAKNHTRQTTNSSNMSYSLNSWYPP